MIIRSIFLVYVALTAAAAFGLSNANATVLFQVNPIGSLSTPSALSGSGRTAFDNFTLSSDATVTSVSWFGSGSLTTDAFQVGIYESTTQDAGTAHPVVAPLFQMVSTVDNTPNAENFGTIDYSLDLGAGAFLQADTIYWLSVRNVTAGRFFWAWRGDTGGAYVSRDNSGTDNFGQLTLFFTLEGNVAGDLGGGGPPPPVALAGPPAAALLVLGLIGISTVQRRHNRTHKKQSTCAKG